MKDFVMRSDVIRLLKEEARDELDCIEPNNPVYAQSYKEAARACKRVADCVKNLPAADVVERKKGEWLAGNGNPRTFGRLRAMCGRCGAFALYEMVNVGSFKEQTSNFCPNCGADMRDMREES